MTSILQPDTPAGAYDEFVLGAAKISAEQSRWLPGDAPMPAWYIGHGAPPLLDDRVWMDQIFDWTTSIAKPTGIIIVSAHWESAPLSVSATVPNTPLVYDFGGFAQRYYTLRYSTPDSGALASRIAAMMPSAEPVYQHAKRGLDHGAWVPLMVMYPMADVPVLQLSIPSHDPARLLEIGRRLRPLRDEGVLIVGSGFLTHGLPFLNRANMFGSVVPGWSSDFDAWAKQALASGDIDALAAFQTKAPGMPYAHPTVEHFTPLFVTLGAAETTDRPVSTAIEGFQLGLSKRSFQVA